MLDALPIARSLLYLLIVGGLVAVPMWQASAPRLRGQAAVLVLLAVWLTFWGWVEDAMGMAFDPMDAWRWDDEIVDLIRWIGWIPFALWLYKRIDVPVAPALRRDESLRAITRTPARNRRSGPPDPRCRPKCE